MLEQQKSVEVFYSYAQQDEKYRKFLEKHLSNLKRQGLITTWNCHEILAGAERTKEINKHLNTASLILLLISPDFLASEYCYGSEMKRAMERFESGQVQVIPILLRPTDWKGTPFDKLQPLPSRNKPVTNWQKQDDAFLDITLGIRKIVEKILSLDKDCKLPIVEKSPTNTPSGNEKVAVLSNSNSSTKFLHIPLFSESLEVDTTQLKKNLQNLYAKDVKDLQVKVDMYGLSAKLIELVEKICQGIEANEVPASAETRPFILRQIRSRSEHWPICLPLYEANLNLLLANLVEEVFSSCKNRLEALSIARESIENTLEYAHYKLVVYLKLAVFSDLAQQFGFSAIAAYLKKYEKYDDQSESIKDALSQIYKYQNIDVRSLHQIVLVASKSRSVGAWRVYFPNITEDDRMAIMFNCRTYDVIDGYSWYVFFLPQVIVNALMDISFGEGVKIEELNYKVGLNLKDYECVGLP